MLIINLEGIKMIKILVFILLLLSGCSVDISESLFIASIGFEMKDEKINGYSEMCLQLCPKPGGYDLYPLSQIG